MITILRYCTIAFLLLASTLQVGAQIQVASPSEPGISYIPTDTVYMAVDGNDTSSGTFNAPVATFNRALQLLPFGTPGVGVGHAYGLIRLKPGTYIVEDGFTQYVNQWSNGNTYKNVSVEGIGDVTIRGELNNFSNTHLLLLTGDHIFIRNLKLRYGGAIGILLERGSDPPRQHDVLIEQVEVDSVNNFGILAVSVDTILIRDSKALYCSRPGSEDLAPPCSWPSGIKFLDCSHTTMHDSEVAYTRGEGLNFQNSTYGLSYNNLLHDNPLNLYVENSALVVIRENYIYNTPGISTRYWKTCPASPNTTKAGAGIMMANEGSCLDGFGGTYSNCYLNCLSGRSYRNVDSVFIYNNIFHNTGTALQFWEGRLENFSGRNCIKNVFFYNNSITNLLWADPNLNAGAITMAFGSYFLLGNSYSYMRNVHIEHNIFALPPSGIYPNMIPVITSTNALAPNQLEVFFNHNIWSRQPVPFGPQDILRPGIPYDFPLFFPDAEAIRPCAANPEYVYAATSPAVYVSSDYSGMSRNAPLSNVGALEEDPTCVISAAQDGMAASLEFSISPNPGNDRIDIHFNTSTNYTVELFSVNSQCLMRQRQAAVLDVSHLSSGIYLVRLTTNEGNAVRKWVKEE